MKSTMHDTNHYGSLLRQIRLEKGLSGEQIGRITGISQSKISKIETGVIRRVTRDDLQAILDALEASPAIRESVFLLAKLTPPPLIYRYPTLTDLATLSEKFLQKELAAQRFRFYTTPIVQVLLQTLDYTEALHKRLEASPETLGEVLKRQQRRKELLWDKTRSFHFILHEAALYSRWIPPHVQITQLEKLVQSSRMPHISIGIIPATAGLAPFGGGSFGVLDNKLAWTETVALELEFTDAVDVGEYVKVFTELDYLAVYDEPMHEMIWDAIEYMEKL